MEDSIRFASELARLRDKALAGRRVAIVLVSNRDGQVENPEAIMEGLRALPADGNAPMEALLNGPINGWRQVAACDAHETLALPDYFLFFNALPQDLQDVVRKRWGAPEADPFFKPGELSCGEFLLPVMRFGNVAVGIHPMRGRDTDPPPHSCIALHAWLRDQFRADAVIPMSGE